MRKCSEVIIPFAWGRPQCGQLWDVFQSRTNSTCQDYWFANTCEWAQWSPGNIETALTLHCGEKVFPLSPLGSVFVYGILLIEHLYVKIFMSWPPAARTRDEKHLSSERKVLKHTFALIYSSCRPSLMPNTHHTRNICLSDSVYINRTQDSHNRHKETSHPGNLDVCWNLPSPKSH